MHFSLNLLSYCSPEFLAWNVTLMHRNSLLTYDPVTLWRISRWCSPLGVIIVKSISSGLMPNTNFMSRQRTPTSMECIEMFKTIVTKHQCGLQRGANVTQAWLKLHYRCFYGAQSEYRGSVVYSGTWTGPTGFIQVSYLTGMVYVPDHPCPSWLYERHRNANWNTTVWLVQCPSDTVAFVLAMLAVGQK